MHIQMRESDFLKDTTESAEMTSRHQVRAFWPNEDREAGYCYIQREKQQNYNLS